MVNKGCHSNGSQFYITLQAAPYLDKKYVAFGYVHCGGMYSIHVVKMSFPKIWLSIAESLTRAVYDRVINKSGTNMDKHDYKYSVRSLLSVKPQKPFRHSHDNAVYLSRYPSVPLSILSPKNNTSSESLQVIPWRFA